MKHIITIIISFYLAACTTVTIQPQSAPTLNSAPDYQNSRDFFFWGLIGNYEVDVSEICGDKPVRQMQTQATFKDSASTFITFGIYTPHTIKIWCQE